MYLIWSYTIKSNRIVSNEIQSNLIYPNLIYPNLIYLSIYLSIYSYLSISILQICASWLLFGNLHEVYQLSANARRRGSDAPQPLELRRFWPAASNSLVEVSLSKNGVNPSIVNIYIYIHNIDIDVHTYNELAAFSGRKGGIRLIQGMYQCNAIMLHNGTPPHVLTIFCFWALLWVVVADFTLDHCKDSSNSYPSPSHVLR